MGLNYNDDGWGSNLSYGGGSSSFDESPGYDMPSYELPNYEAPDYSLGAGMDYGQGLDYDLDELPYIMGDDGGYGGVDWDNIFAGDGGGQGLQFDMPVDGGYQDPFGVGYEGGGGGTDWGGIGRGAMGLLGGISGDDMLNWGRFGAGAAGMYLNNRANKDALSENKRQFDETMGLNRDQFGLNQRTADIGALDNYTSKALGMQLLRNKGKFTDGQVDPWLNMMHTGLSQSLGDSSVSSAFASNPFEGFGLGARISAPNTSDPTFQAGNPFFASRLGGGFGGMLGGLSSGMGGAGQAGSGSGGPGRITIGNPMGFASGGQVPGPLTQVARLQGFIPGPGGGQSDTITAQVSPGEYVMDAETVSMLGDGNSEEGGRRLDQMRKQLRVQKRAAPQGRIPATAKTPMDYLGD